ncbi:hypothetical protein Cgig2_024448 [Carnegiea gigantea]|uniref:NB-ARC domain-containing protein n=1 Tax=Carnegiea gigantea TaxID=171969 RepID=A0A9Q1QK50_9CARY|nr:hypothetical protein Cgig2_024448 [Carnegiea gigantea]
MSIGLACLGILTGGAGQAVSDAAKRICHSIKCKYNYIKNLDQNLNELEMETGYLSHRKKDIDANIAHNQVTMQTTNECAQWLEDVLRMMEKVEDIRTRYQEVANGSRRMRLLSARLKLSKEIEEMKNSVVDLRKRMENHDVLVERPPQRVEKKFPKNIYEVPSLREHVEKLLELLKDDNIKKIGLWGMPGVGKTTILENLNNEVDKLQVFDIVIWVTAPQELNLRQMQQEILQRLKERTDWVEHQNKANLISQSLANKKYLLLLDEVFYKFDLSHIGFHDKCNGKVVLATRDKTICNLMETDEEIKVERLSRDDARKLFHSASRGFIEPIAERVLKQCGDLPHIIRAVANYLKDKDKEPVWRGTLSKLQSPNMHQLKHMEDVFNPFKVILEELGGIKDCLLYAASFPQDHEIYRDYLIECWKAEQLIGVGETFRRIRDEGHITLEDLIDKCLLDACKSSKCVKMPIIFRNTAITVANEHRFGLLVTDMELGCPPVESWESAKRISLMNSDLVELPHEPDCSEVSSLLLQKNENLSVIPPSFFDSMSTLKILDLCGTGISSVPPTVSNLTNLQGLYLNDCCRLVHLPQQMQLLKKVELLDICRTGLCTFAAVIGGLTSLRCLRVSFTNATVGNRNHIKVSAEVTPLGTIQQLSNLEELTIHVNLRDPEWKEIEPDIAKEVATLEKLSNLSFWFTSTASLETFIRTSKSWKNGSSQAGSNFRSFNLIVGSQETESPRLDVLKCTGPRYLQYSAGSDIPTVSIIKKVLRITSAFELIGHGNITHFSDFGIDVMGCLEVCLVERCDRMKTFLGCQKVTAFPCLRELHLLRLQELKAINEGVIPSGSFAKLRTLTLYDCPEIIKVVSWDTAKQLCQLQHLRVENCSKVEEIIATDNQSCGIGAFPKLKILELVMLEDLVRIHSDNSFEWVDLQQIEIFKCNNLVDLQLRAENAKKLQCIQCSEVWWLAMAMNGKVEANLQDSHPHTRYQCKSVTLSSIIFSQKSIRQATQYQSGAFSPFSGADKLHNLASWKQWPSNNSRNSMLLFLWDWIKKIGDDN